MRPNAILSLSSTIGVLLGYHSVGAIDLNLEDEGSIKSAASTIARDMLQYYTGDQPGQIPGLLPGPYYWWEAGAMFGTLIDYWYYTGDHRYNTLVSEAMLFQVGPLNNYMPPNQTSSLGNDDQAFWGLAAMSAAEVAFPNPPEDQPQWLALAQGVFNSQIPRWDMSTCGGGLRWQIFSFNLGYTYKNSISNGCFFNLGARLGAYTQNKTYFEQAEKAWDWSANIGLITDTYQVYDGSDDTINCTRVNAIQWSYNSAVYLLGAAVMWNQTEGAEQQKWEDRVNGLLEGIKHFFDNQVMFESYCEERGKCDIDQQSFKAYTSRWMAATTKVAPWTQTTIMPYLAISADAAAKACTGGDSGTQCGMRWTTGSYDGLTGVGQQMNALEVIQSNLVTFVRGPLSKSTGGISQGNPNAGVDPNLDVFPGFLAPVSTKDRAGAGILTTLMVISILGFAWWLII